MPDQINITLTASQITFISANYRRMTYQEMADALGITKAKINGNMPLLGLQYKRKCRERRIMVDVTAGFFHVESYLKTLVTI